MAAELESSTLRVYNAHQQVVGAGFLVGEGTALTCAHVVGAALGLAVMPQQAPQATLTVDFPLVEAGNLLQARVTFWDAQQDMAGLSLESQPPEGARPAHLLSTRDVWGDELRVFGFPAGYPFGVWAPGELLGRNAAGWIQIEGVRQSGYFVAPGFSGAPVWDQTQGGVVGMVVAADLQPDVRAAFIIPAETLVRVWPALEVSSQPTPKDSQPANPFFCGGRINDPAQFFGRQRLLREIRAELGKRASVSLVGDSEMGKSSLLYYLFRTRDEWLPDAPVEYIDLQRVLDEADLCETILARLGLAGDSPRDLKRALESRPLVLLLDEVERLAQPDFNPRLHDLLRSLAQEPTFAMCVATQRPLVEIFPARTPSGVSPFHNIFTVKLLDPFNESEARQFLASRLAGTGVRFSPQQVERLVSQSAGHPAKLQRMAKELFEEMVR